MQLAPTATGFGTPTYWETVIGKRRRNMTTEIEEKLYTVEEFLNLDLPDEDDEEYELVKGRLVAIPKGGTSGEHGKVVFNLAGYLKSYLLNNPVGKGYAEASTMLGRPEGSSYFKPDVCFVAAGRTPDQFRGPIPVAPDLAVEVWSPSDSFQDVQDKIEVYQQAEVRLIWSIYTLQRFVAVYRLGDPDTKLLNLQGELDGEEVLPGFKLSVKALFE